MRRLIFAALAAMSMLTVNAQLKVNQSGKVGIGSTLLLNPSLTIGNSTYSQNSSFNIGVASSPISAESVTNVGVEGVAESRYNYTSDSNCGVRGLVAGGSNYHGRNYGVSGIYGGTLSYGGAGIYGAESYLQYLQGANIQGKYAGYFDGNVYISTSLTIPQVLTSSDIRLKDNIVSMEETEGFKSLALENILGLNVIEYNYKKRNDNSIKEEVYAQLLKENPEVLKELEKQKDTFCSKRHFGLSAQELQTVYPNLVEEGQDGYLSVNYIELVPVLIRSIQELKQELDEVKGAKDDARMSRGDVSMVSAVRASGNILYQNTPNPFKEKTAIRFHLADDAKEAAVCIFDMSGKLLKKLPVSSGMESVAVNGYELGEGMFLYTLMVNGQDIDTKRMILSK